MTQATIHALVQELLRYRDAHVDERDTAERFLAFAHSGDDVCLRSRPDGHFTASCWLLCNDGERVLLTHHRKLDRWLQPGGHADGDADLARVAWREAAEESGLPDLLVEGAIFDLDAHTIPAHGAEPAHLHWDVRYVVHCRGSEDYVVSAESHALVWVPVATVLASDDASLRRMAAKWLARAQGRPTAVG